MAACKSSFGVSTIKDNSNGVEQYLELMIETTALEFLRLKLRVMVLHEVQLRSSCSRKNSDELFF